MYACKYVHLWEMNVSHKTMPHRFTLSTCVSGCLDQTNGCAEGLATPGKMVPPPVNAELLQQLEEMGFTKACVASCLASCLASCVLTVVHQQVRAEKALWHTGNQLLDQVWPRSKLQSLRRRLGLSGPEGCQALEPPIDPVET